jgi:hypothetical protein
LLQQFSGDLTSPLSLHPDRLQKLGPESTLYREALAELGLLPDVITDFAV